ncbi:inorganic phosphate transporter [Megasphaera vaginalis (ex Bordigoni et al. 2020)]|uniref:inorganic phosphate transporter n=1 Tax=Megasphaera vaginalis (ex Bordigoni et al. 2020) TaxID=2045301 RepID=UPI000C7A80E9|nr:inorganic phosphate transporter [Megasphaera vaginalis (ex Bordigoni et al. 2020)]
MPDNWLIWTVVLFAVLFDYINGFHDTANAIATSVSTRAISPRHAVVMAAVLNFCGAMVSTGVAKTIGGDLVLNPAQISLEVIIAALIGSIIWNILTWYYRLPSSSSHSLVGGVIGAVCISVGPAALDTGGIGKIVLSLILSPVVALVSGYFVMIAILWIFRCFSPIALNRRFRKMQLISASLMAFSHGSNDAQKAMGIIALALLSGGYIDTMEIPVWVKFACATSMALGTSAGGWRIISTMGTKIFKLASVNGFAADLNSSLVIFMATFLHLPVSTTHVVSGSIMGIGSAERVRAVHWGVARSMLIAWVVTIPISGCLAAFIFVVIHFLFH